MKNCPKQKRAYDKLQDLAYQKTKEIQNEILTKLKEIKDFLLSSKKAFRKILENALSIIKDDDDLSSHIVRCNEFNKQIVQACTAIRKELKENYIPLMTNTIKEVTSTFSDFQSQTKAILQNIYNTFDNYYSQLNKSLEYTNGQTALDSGFANHCNFLSYINAIDQIEPEYLSIIEKIQVYTHKYVEFSNKTWTKINELYSKEFPIAKPKHLGRPKTPILTSAYQDSFNIIREESMKIFQIFREPELNLGPANQFKPTQIQMYVKYRYLGTDKGEISVREGDIVQLIDCSGNMWEVQKDTPDKEQGLIPPLYLRPMPSVK